MRKIFEQWGKCCLRLKRTAFTLAEVLIVLGIIGIVASMTIPTLMNKVAKQEYLTALKKFYSTQTDGWSRLLADEGVQQLEDTSVFQSMTTPACGVSSANYAPCKPFYDGLKKYFKFNSVTAPSYQTYQLNGTKYIDYTGETVLAFADGSVMFTGQFYKSADKRDETESAQIAAGGGHMYSSQGWFWIDINGFKKPNTRGRDIFEFSLSGDGKLYPYRGKDYSLYNYGNLNRTWQTGSSYCGTAGSTDVSGADGLGCAARIMDEGWQMNY